MSALTTNTWAPLVLSGPLGFAGVAAMAVRRPRDNGRLRRAGAVASWFGVAVAAVAGSVTAADRWVQSPTFGLGGLGLSVRLDPISVVMFVMISVLAVVIFRFSCTYLDGDDRCGVFLGRLAVTIAAVEILVISGNLALLMAAWVATSLALHRLLVFYPERRRAVLAARKKFIVARTGDAFLASAAVLLYHQFGTGNLERIFVGVRAMHGSSTSGSVQAAGVCIVVAAILKSAQFPTHGWLVEVMETPTPVSALLHAGILNAGPFLVVRMAYVVEDVRPATALLIAVGGFTAVFASVVLLTQPSVKVSLGYSSAAHMGFMLMICGIGVFPAALLHLVAHSFYKAHAFLSSGSVIDETRAAKVALARRLGSPIRLAGSVVVALSIYLALAVAWRVDFRHQPTLLAIGAILVMGTTQLVAPALDSAGPAVGVARAAVLAVWVTAAFFGLEHGLAHLLGDAVPIASTPDALNVALIGLVLAGFGTVVAFQILEPARPKSTRRRAVAIHLRNGLYANALFDKAVGAMRTAGGTGQ